MQKYTSRRQDQETDVQHSRTNVRLKEKGWGKRQRQEVECKSLQNKTWNNYTLNYDATHYSAKWDFSPKAIYT